MSAADWRRVGPVSVSMDGRRTDHADLEGAVRRIGRSRLEQMELVGEAADPDDGLEVRPRIVPIRRPFGVLPVTEPLRVRDETGIAVPLWRILEAVRDAAIETSEEWNVRWHRERWGPYVFRAGPVGGTACRSRSGSMYRRIRTTNERRAAWGLLLDEDASEIGVRPRAGRGCDSLPNDWEEILTADAQRSWKKHRRTQWRA